MIRQEKVSGLHSSIPSRLANFPDHKHVGGRENLEPSSETSLEAVMKIILSNK
jgi:hypothetical protein